MMISLLLPTKNRTEKLKEAIDSVSNTITKRRPIEILIGIEKDDKNTLNSINEINVPPSVSIKPVIFNQFEYVNNTKYFEMDKTLFNTLQSARIAEINKLKEYIEDFKKKNVT